MAVGRAEEVALRDSNDVVRARQEARRFAVASGFGLVEQTKIVTAASELARNTVVHGGGGSMLIESLEEGSRRGLRLTFVDRGPGIRDIEAALRDGYTTGNGLGLGLGGARRLMSEFKIVSDGVGTTVVAVRWR